MTKKIEARELESELILYDTEQDDVHVLNATAKLIYKLHEEGKGTTEIEEEVRKSFQFEEEQDVHGHVQRCIGDMKKKGLII